jgi:hypothetical protein
MSYGALGSTGFGATGGPAWYQVWSPGNKWAGWLWADAAAALRVANTCASVIRTASGHLVGKTIDCSNPFRTNANGEEVPREECFR